MLKLLLSVFTLSLLIPSARAGKETNQPAKETVPASIFARGANELQLGIGYNFSSNSNGPLRPRLADVSAALRYGWMLNSPGGVGPFRGNCELLLEAVGGAVTDGPGGALVGGTFFFRYNFIHSARWVPYFQIGLGAVYDDIYRQRPQRLLGESFEFTVQGELGMRYFLNSHTALYAEAGYRHISNAGLADRNYGLNSVAFQGGVSWFW